jgi:bifunctional ADP-heptose synthase (sugar kinase/adenylyltransferase)
MRVSYEDHEFITTTQIDKMLKELKKEKFDAIVIVDYQNGMITPQLLGRLGVLQVPLFIDPKPNNVQFSPSGSVIKINNADCIQATALSDDILGAKYLCEKLQSNILLTRSEKGCAYFGVRDEKPLFVRNKVTSVVDETGAGDTFLATFVVCCLRKESIENALKYSNLAGNVATQVRGLYQPTKEEIVYADAKRV